MQEGVEATSEFVLADGKAMGLLEAAIEELLDKFARPGAMPVDWVQSVEVAERGSDAG